jgi:cytochrome c553
MRHGSINLCAALLVVCATAVYATPRAQREFDYVLRRTPDPMNGAEIYQTCAACHGVDGSGTSDGAVPALGGQVFTVIAKQLVDFRVRARVDERMAHFTDVRHLAYSQDIADVAAYISTVLKPREWRVLSGDLAAGGAAIYSRECERCHRAVAEGDEDTLVPRLGGQRHGYILSQLTAPAKRRPAMHQAHKAFQSRLTQEDVRALATYLSGDDPDQREHSR